MRVLERSANGIGMWFARRESANSASLWDPLAWLGPARHVLWAFIAVNLLILQWPTIIENIAISSPRHVIPDFFQDYAACKNALHNMPVYTEHEVTTRLYLEPPQWWDVMVVHVNAHPPSSVLFAMPFVWLDFRSAFLATNLLSLVALAYSLRLVVHELGIAFGPGCYLPSIALAVICYPVLEHLYQGQVGLYLSVLLLGAWACDRKGRRSAAGSLIGIAAAVKLFPIFLLAFFAWRRRWDVVTAGLATVVVVALATASVVGIQAFADYLLVVIPRVSWFRVAWNNVSILGFFSRLFDPLPAHPDNLWWRTEALVQSSSAMFLGWAAAATALVAAFAWATSGLADRTERDLGFGLAMVCMVLLSPVAWEHYLVLMMLPLALLWKSLPSSGAAGRKLAILAVVVLFWASPRGIQCLFGLQLHIARPADVVLILSSQFYALIGLFLLVIDALVRHRRDTAPTPISAPSP